MKTVIYEIATNKIINITENNVDFSKLPSNQNNCPISFFEQTDNGKKHLNDYYNIINIKPIKNSWNREEVVKLFHKYKCDHDGEGSYSKEVLNRWIEENLWK